MHMWYCWFAQKLVTVQGFCFKRSAGHGRVAWEGLMPPRLGPFWGLEGCIDGWTLGTTFWDDEHEDMPLTPSISECHRAPSSTSSMTEEVCCAIDLEDLGIESSEQMDKTCAEAEVESSEVDLQVVYTVLCSQTVICMYSSCP